MNLIMGLLMYLLGSAAIMSITSAFGVSINIFQAISVWIIFSFAVSIIKNI